MSDEFRSIKQADYHLTLWPDSKDGDEEQDIDSRHELYDMAVAVASWTGAPHL